MPEPSRRTPWYRVLYIQVLLAVLAGIVVGWWFPAFGVSLRPLGVAVAAGMLGVTFFGLLFTPVFYYVVMWFAGSGKGKTAAATQEAAAESLDAGPAAAGESAGHPW